MLKKCIVKFQVFPKEGECGMFYQDKNFKADGYTNIEGYPWTVLLEYTKPNGIKAFHCGGVLINTNYILTASHCVKI